MAWHLRWTHRPNAPTAVVLVLHGGSADSRRPARWTDLSVLRMLPLARSARQAGHGAFAVAMIRYAVKGWNGAAASPVADTRAALAEIETLYPGRPIALVGHSMGGRVALALADDPRVSDIVGLAPWVVTPEMRSHEDLRVLFVHGLPDRITSAAASRQVVESLQARGRTASFIGLRGENHAMLRRPGVWNQLVRGYLRATLGMPRDSQKLSEVEELGATASAGQLITEI